MARVLWIGDAGCHTGFGRVTHAIGDRLVTDHGHDVHTLAINFDGDAGRWPTPMKLYRASKLEARDIHGTGRHVEMIAEVLPDVVVLLQDPFAIMQKLFRNKRDEHLILARARPVIAYMPIDGINQPTNWQRVPEAIAKLEPVAPGEPQPTYQPVAMSQFGLDIMGGDAKLIYHGVDWEAYHPVSESSPITTSLGLKVTSRKEAKRAFGLPEDSFLVLRVDRNSRRKDYADTWKALVPVMKRHKDVIAWFHCQPQNDEVELTEVLSRDPATADRFHFPALQDTFRGWPDNDLAVLYNAADLFVSTSWGEGFGLTLAEAAACGVPVVAQNVSSIPEVVGPGGVLIDSDRLITVTGGQDQWLPDVDAFTDAIEHLYISRGARRDLGAAGRQHVVNTFSWDVAAQQFSDLINGLAQQAAGSPGGHDAEPEAVAAGS